MSKKIAIGNDLFDEDIIAFVRKLKKVTKSTSTTSEGAHIPGMSYIVQLKQGYSLDGKGQITSIFLNNEGGLAVLQQLLHNPETVEKPPKQW